VKVLVVEDDPDQRRLLTLIVRSFGHEPVACANLAEARAAEACPVALVDHQLPDGNGLFLARELAGRVYLLTGDEDVRAEAGVEILLKPVRPAQLASLLDPADP